ncbi:ANTAR domain-containing protein [Streptomyces griseofuscus]|uniref:ANTAR domain-containing protein n=1 Tax=Streptomyces griseofuscus TaxID=146922 RepID=UPI0036BE02BB
MSDKIVRLNEENAQLQQAVVSHAVIDQAVGVLVAVWQVPPTDGWEVLVEVSQHCNLKLRAVAEDVVGWPLGRPLPQEVERELEARIQRWKSRTSRSCDEAEGGEDGGSPG